MFDSVSLDNVLQAQKEACLCLNVASSTFSCSLI